MIDILLSTYNGEKYLAELLDSLLCQTCCDWRLICRDDGSNDSTQTILHQFQTIHTDKIEILADSGDNIGVIKSFETLLSHSTAEYFMFCDQDDVWNADKVEKSVIAIQEMEKLYGKDKPLVAHSDLAVVDSKLNIISNSYFKWYKIDPEYIYSDIHRALLFNAVPGCTLIGNKTVRILSLPFAKNIMMHDAWIVQCALLNGGHIKTLNEPLIKYRQHEGNVIGALFKKITLKQRILNNWKHLLFFFKYAKFPIFLKFLYYKFQFKLHR